MFTVRKYLSLALWSHTQVLFTDSCIFGETIWLHSKEESIRGLQYFENYFANCINEENTTYNLATFLKTRTTIYNIQHTSKAQNK